MHNYMQAYSKYMQLINITRYVNVYLHYNKDTLKYSVTVFFTFSTVRFTITCNFIIIMTLKCIYIMLTSIYTKLKYTLIILNSISIIKKKYLKMYFKVDFLYIYLACYDSHDRVLSFWSFISLFNSCFGDLIN